MINATKKMKENLLSVGYQITNDSLVLKKTYRVYPSRSSLDQQIYVVDVIFDLRTTNNDGEINVSVYDYNQKQYVMDFDIYKCPEVKRFLDFYEQKGIVAVWGL